MPYRVTYAIDSLDPNPLTMEFDEFWEASDWLHGAVQDRVNHIVQHSQYSISDDELCEIYETEYYLTRINKV